MPAPRSDASSPLPESRSGAFPELAALLWTVRETLESVLYRLVVVRLIVTDGSPRWLPKADEELQDVLDTLRSVEVLRAAEVDGLVRSIQKPGRSTLLALANVAPEPWPAVFAEHRDALRLLATEIDAAVGENKRVLKTALKRNRMPAACNHPARDDGAVTAAVAFRAAAATLESVPQLSLLEFLG